MRLVIACGRYPKLPMQAHKLVYSIEHTNGLNHDISKKSQLAVSAICAQKRIPHRKPETHAISNVKLELMSEQFGCHTNWSTHAFYYGHNIFYYNRETYENSLSRNIASISELRCADLTSVLSAEHMHPGQHHADKLH